MYNNKVNIGCGYFNQSSLLERCRAILGSHHMGNASPWRRRITV